MDDIKQFKEEVDKLHKLVHDTNVGYGVFYAKLDIIMRELGIQYWGNIPTPVAFPEKRKQDES